MNREVLDSLRALLDTERVLTAAVLVDDEPVAALLPFAVSTDYTALYVQASGLARHAAGLQSGASVGVLVHAAAAPDRDPMQLPRVSLQATSQMLVRSTGAFETAAARLVERFPVAASTLILGDFNLYALVLERGRFVEGFARAVNVGPDTLLALAKH